MDGMDSKNTHGVCVSAGLTDGWLVTGPTRILLRGGGGGGWGGMGDWTSSPLFFFSRHSFLV